LATVNQVGTRGSDVRRQEILAGRYRVLGGLSAGAAGEVFLVEDIAQGGRCALKLLPAQVSTKQLRGEFARLTELTHPSIVRVLDAGMVPVGPAAGRAFLVTEYLSGPSLADSLPANSPSVRFSEFARAAEALADALAYLHGRGILHGDLSPANIRCDGTGRPILIDFGLAGTIWDAVVSGQHGVTGTLGFIAPEALLGERGPAGDLFALGATLYDAWAGAPPFGLGIEAVRRAWQGPPPPPASLHPGLPPAWDHILLRLLAAAAEDRPASAREALQEIRRALPDHPVDVATDLSPPFPAGDPFAGLWVGRGEEESALRRHIEQLAQGAASVCVVCVTGAPGSGRHALIQRALRETRLSTLSQTLDAVDLDEGECSELVARAMATAGRQGPPLLGEPGGELRERMAYLVAELEQRAAGHPLCLALAGSPEDEMLARAVSGNPPSGRLLLLLPCERAPAGTGIATIQLGPLSREAIAELARRSAGVEAAATVIEQVAAGSAGLAGLVVLLLRSWIENLRAGKPQTIESMSGGHDMAHLLDASFASLSERGRACVLRVALSGDTASIPAAPEMVDREGELAARRAGWLRPTTMALPSEAHVASVWRALPGDPKLASQARQLSGQLLVGDPRLAEVQLALGERGRAAASFWQAMQAAETRMAWSRVAHFGLRARAASGGSATTAQRLTLAHALGILGRYDEALETLEGCASRGTGDISAKVAERKAWLLGRRGDPESARRLLEAGLARLPAGAEDALLLRSRLARLLIASGRYGEAFATAEPALDARSAAGGAARESAVLALAYAGKLETAAKLLGTLRADAAAAADIALAARVAALEGLVGQLAGRPLEAAGSYQRAVTDYERVRDLHGAAAATFNLGCTLAEIGDYGGAITAFERAIRELGRLGAVTDHALAVFNVGQLFLQLGDLDAASRAIERLRADAETSRVEAFRGYGGLLAAELQRRRGALEKCVPSYASAGTVFARLGMQAMAIIAGLGQAEVLAERGQMADAHARLRDSEVAAGASAEASPDAPWVEALALARARIALCDPEVGAAETAALAEALVHAAQAGRDRGRLPAAWRLGCLAARLFTRAGDARGDAQLELARKCFAEVKMKTPPRYWPGLESDGDARLLTPNAGAGRDMAALIERSASLESRLRRLLRINKRLNSDLRLSRVLETIIDTVIELTDAERGFLLLKDGGGELVVKVARNIEQTTLEGPGLSLSRSIAKQAAETGEPVITVDAAGDSRFAEHLSVSDLHLRSVLAVPLAVKGTVVGTIYVDHRLRKGVFGDDELAMVLDFAEQGAIAIENARIISELRRREQQIQSLNRRLERELTVQAAALDDARVELKESRQAAALRYDYRQIIGQSPGMLDLFRLLDRVTDTNLPVVIEGESGTGKELVARAIHFHGPRKDKAFVSENCAAIPETLLESALFGHVRGAFTGAERDARGLFAVANGGTLFLEVADMSPAMQGKLLRVLQDGEFHRVGSERPEKVDVRLLVASNRNLGRMVEDGKFRKDLFYRLSVVRLYLPPLRERREDIPLLLRHFLAKSAEQTGQAPKQIETAALTRLCAYAWPGNVRELENEIARTAAFAGASIGVADLSPQVQSGQDPTEVIRNEPDSLRLRQRVERLERQLIREAMGRSQANQTRAATLLGLSRFGLQKKLRRYNLGT
jgi:transcriptional regulator with GAF, ATPase, and Fis domain